MVGKSGGPCKHQFLLWWKVSSPNFLPDREKRQVLATIAIGDSLPDSYYEDLHTIQSDLLDEVAVDSPVDIVNITNNDNPDASPEDILKRKSATAT